MEEISISLKLVVHGVYHHDPLKIAIANSCVAFITIMALIVFSVV